MTVGFEQALYTVSEEDKEVEVCVAISSPANIDLTVIATLSTSDDTAEGIPSVCICLVIVRTAAYAYWKLSVQAFLYHDYNNYPFLCLFSIRLSAVCLNALINCLYSIVQMVSTTLISKSLLAFPPTMKRQESAIRSPS